MKKSLFKLRKGFLVLGIFGLTLLVSSLPCHAQWTLYNLPDPEWVFDKIHFTSLNEGWAIGLNGDSLFHYLNGEWTAVTPPYEGNVWQLNALHFTSPDEGWVVGQDWNYESTVGVLLHYLNGSWTVVPPPEVSTSWDLVGVHFSSSNEGWAIGNDWENSRVVLLHYLDDTWISVPPPTLSTSRWDLYDIYFTSSNEGWAVGSNGGWTGRGVLLHYLNGSWKSVKPPNVSQRWSLSHIHFVSPNEGWAVGGDSINHKGVLLHYHNGRWERVYPPRVSRDWDLMAVHFTSPKEGWAVGYDWNHGNRGGVLLHYRNGSWKYVKCLDLTTGWDLNDVYFVSRNEGWAVGFGGVLKYFVPPPDLEGEWITLNKFCKPTNTDVSCKVTGKLRIRNIGGDYAPSSRIKFYLSSDNIFDEGVDNFVKQVSIRKVKVGGSTTKTLKFSFLTSEIPSANYVIAVLDAENVIAEIDEGNNIVVYPIP